MNTVEAVIEKKGIPLKSRIAAWWMLIVGGIFGVIGLALLLGTFTGGIKAQDELGLVVFIFGLGGIAIFIVYFLPGLLVLKGGRWGWITASVILSVAIAVVFGLKMYDIFYYYNYYNYYNYHAGLSSEYLSERFSSLLSLIPFLIPLTLILLDHISYKRVALLPIFIVIAYFGSLIIVRV
jgi:hypothetical protein